MQTGTEVLQKQLKYEDETKGLGDHAEHSTGSGDPFIEFLMECVVIAMIAIETQSMTAVVLEKYILITAKNIAANVVQVLYMSVKEEIKAPSFHIHEEYFIDVSHKGFGHAAGKKRQQIIPITLSPICPRTVNLRK